jgi:hypothetical protein
MSEKDLNALESALRDLRPTARPLNRDVLMYYAGRAAVPRGMLVWKLATAGSAFVAVVMSLALAMRQGDVRPVDRVVHVPAPALAPDPEPVPPLEEPTPAERRAAPLASPWEPPVTRYEQVRDDVLRRGLDGLPAGPRVQHKPVTAEQVLWPF